MGEVFMAVAKGVHQHCVIKTIRTDLHGEREFVGRFTDEAKIMVRIDHPNIIRVFDCGKVGDDYYIAMEYVHGRDLGDVLDRAYERGEPMPTQLGLYVATQLLAGLQHVHELTDERGRYMKLVHRDVSPQNVLVGFDGSVRLIDFGLARSELLPSRTQGALAVGKYGYMSPEQARHEDLDGRADLYSAGVMLFEVFTGDRLVDEQDQATLWNRVLNPSHRRPRSVVPSLPSEIDDLIMTAVATKPHQRFSSAHKMRSFCERLLEPRDHARALTRYLRYLYPTADFSPPPVPDLAGFVERVDESVIIATSRKKQRSVFGRGELPVEGTMQFDARALREALAADRSARRGARVGFEEPRIGFVDSTASETWVSTDTDSRPTQISTNPLRTAPVESLDDAETRVQPPADEPSSVHRDPSVTAAGVFDDDEDEEQTVMMALDPRPRSETEDPVLDATVLSRRRPEAAMVQGHAGRARGNPALRPARFVPVEEISAAPRDELDPSRGESTWDGEAGVEVDQPEQDAAEYGLPKLGFVVVGAGVLGFLIYGLLSLL